MTQSQRKTLLNDFNFDLIAEEYGNFRFHSNAVMAFLRECLGLAKFQEFILELGAGTGNYCTNLYNNDSQSVIAIDISPSMLSILKDKEQAIDCILEDCNTVLPFQQESLDFIYSVDFIHYIPNFQNLFLEAYRTLRVGGLFLVGTHDFNDIHQQTMGFYFPKTIEIEEARLHSGKSILQTLKESGFHNPSVHKITEKFNLDTQDLDLYRFKTVSALGAIDKNDFNLGLAKMERDIKNSQGHGFHSYTFYVAKKN